jgi:RNA polymerase sigma-70 factor (ECF subfamily)
LASIKSIDYNILIENCLKNKEWAQKELYDMHSAELYGLCFRYAADEPQAKDMLQEGFIRIFVNLKQYKATGSLIGWMKRVMVTTALNYIKKNRKYFTEDTENYTEHFTAKDTIESNLQAKEIMEAFVQLPYHYRVALGLYIIDGYNYKEISEILQLEESSCRTKVHRGKLMLKKIITENELIYPELNNSIP